MAHPGESLSRYLGKGDLLVERYRIEDAVGYGAFGAIYSAIDQDTGERVAVKALPPESEHISQTALARFRREMKVISTLVHRNIVGLYDFGQTGRGVFFMILEYVDGKPLDRVVRGHPMEADDVLSVCDQICSALELAHHRGVIHRDLKPANIMITGEPGAYGAKVLDFGMAKLLSRIDDESVVQLTREGMAVGTPRYIAPEQARGEQVGPWTDLYALGLLVYEMLTGARAVKADDVEGAVSAHVSREPLELHEIDRVPEGFRPLLFGLIEKDPDRRFRGAKQVLAEVDALRFQAVDGRAVLDPKRGRLEGGGSSPQRGQERSEGERRARAREIIAARQADEELELDEEARRRVPGRSAPPRSRPAPRGARWFRLPERAGEWFESGLSPLVGLFGFVVLTAPLAGVSYEFRLAVGLMPVGAALSWSVLSGRGDWRYSFFRLWNLLSLAAIVIAHALGPRKLITALYRNPAWLITPVDDVAGMDTVGVLLSTVARWYATLLTGVLDWSFGVID